MSGTVGHAVGRQNSPDERMVASSAAPSATVSARARSGPAIHRPRQSVESSSAVSNHPGRDHVLAAPAVVRTRTAQKYRVRDASGLPRKIVHGSPELISPESQTFARPSLNSSGRVATSTRYDA